MTTVVCTKTEMACDLQFTNLADGSKWKGKTKIYKFSPHPLTYPDCEFIVGFAGTASDIITIAHFFSLPEDFKNPPKIGTMSGVVLTAKQDIFVFDKNPLTWLLMNEPYAAIGSGGSFAIGALASGANVREAIKIASKHDCYTGMGTKILKF